LVPNSGAALTPDVRSRLKLIATKRFLPILGKPLLMALELLCVRRFAKYFAMRGYQMFTSQGAYYEPCTGYLEIRLMGRVAKAFLSKVNLPCRGSGVGP